MVQKIVNERRVDLLDDYLAPEFEAHGIVASRSGGSSDVKLLIQQWSVAFPDWRDTIIRTVCEGEYVTILVRATGTHLGTVAGIPPTGRRVEWDMLELVHVKDGKILEQWSYSSFAHVLSTLRGGDALDLPALAIEDRER
jgi:predicted ester cyclase